MKHIFSFFVAAILCACSTTPVNELSAKHVPSERIYRSELVTTSPQQGKAVVSFFRDSGLLGSGCSYDLFVNNEKTFSIRQAEFIRIALIPGPYFFRIETGGGLCPNLATSQNSVLTENGKESYRIIPSAGNISFARIE